MNAYEICQEIERRMAAMGVVTTAHYDAGTELIAEAIRQAVAEEREACAKLAESKHKILLAAAIELCGSDLARTVNGQSFTASEIAAAIRARGNT